MWKRKPSYLPRMDQKVIDSFERITGIKCTIVKDFPLFEVELKEVKLLESSKGKVYDLIPFRYKRI